MLGDMDADAADRVRQEWLTWAAAPSDGAAIDNFETEFEDDIEWEDCWTWSG
ncbi:MAG: hypothetical protein MI757_14700 [Pirellulales bacterium]|nr:hypothetical protein [Pirellulales bacterium]